MVAAVDRRGTGPATRPVVDWPVVDWPVVDWPVVDWEVGIKT
jgi:hypothetical protein